MPEHDKPERPAPKKAELRPVTEWARALGEYSEPKRFEEGNGYSAAHNAAAALHGWEQHAHDAGEPMALTESDYRAALEAAMPAENNPRAHQPALSKFCPHHGGHC